MISYINSIENFLDKKYNKCPITVPINDIPSNLSETNIKYILDFYQEIYPKFVNYFIANLILKFIPLPSKQKNRYFYGVVGKSKFIY